MDQAVARVRARMQPAGLDPDYDLAYEHFDLVHFLLQVRPLLAEDSTVDPLRRFLDNGAGAKASPEINFSMQAYLERYPQRATGSERSPYLEWLKRGRAEGEIADPAPGLDSTASLLGVSPHDLADSLGALRSGLQARLRSGTLGEMFARAAEVEPLIGDAWTETTRPSIPPLLSSDTVAQVAALSRSHAAARFAPARLVLVVSDPRWGGGRRIEGHIAHALAGRIEPADIVVVYTDDGGAAPSGRFPAGTRQIDFAREITGMSREAAQHALVQLIGSFAAEAVVNINSRLLYEAMSLPDASWTRSERIFLMLFGNEQLPMGHWVGIPLRFFYRCLPLVEGVMTDSRWLATWLEERHLLGPDEVARLHVLTAPVDPSLPLAAAPDRQVGDVPQVYWAGRWDRQKRVDIAFEVARRMPEVRFRMWGASVLNAASMEHAPGNVSVEGAYAHISELDLDRADAWLYTSQWDGVPSQLLEVGMTGIPIVGSLVGGTGEVLSFADAWPVADFENPEAYVRALREVLDDLPNARRRATALRERLLDERSEPVFADHVAGLLLTTPTPNGARP